jgi:hypothetical protein
VTGDTEWDIHWLSSPRRRHDMNNLIEHLKTELTDNRCKHPACSCKVVDGDRYCSAQCEGMGETPDINCLCGHAGCTGRIE